MYGYIVETLLCGSLVRIPYHHRPHGDSILQRTQFILQIQTFVRTDHSDVKTTEVHWHLLIAYSLHEYILHFCEKLNADFHLL